MVNYDRLPWRPVISVLIMLSVLHANILSSSQVQQHLIYRNHLESR